MERLLAQLRDCCEVLPDLQFSLIALIALDPFAVQFRYEDSLPISDSNRIAMRQAAVTLREYVVGRILELESTS